MKQCLLIASLLASASVASAEPGAAPVVERARLEVQPGGKPIKQLSIENPLGDVKVEGYDGASIQIETRKQAPDDEGLDRLRVSLVPNPDGTVRLTATADGGAEYRTLPRGAVRIDLIIRAPRDARIDAVASAGHLEVINMDGGGELDTASGRISVRNMAGVLTTNTVSGETSLAQVFGTIDAQALSADLSLDTIAGERLIASVNRGKIAGRRIRSRQIELTSTDGRIVLEGEAMLHGRMVIASLNGDVEVRLRRAVPVLVRARGTKVDLGSAMTNAKAQQDAWLEAQVGRVAPGATPALVQLSSRHGNVQLVFVE
ncbi:MAG: DUF4097 family beta strand repeat-containing protein [Kofleriaceae bacterium]|nr:DUF4097 family beta strand repeat-containing protein [Kofleriaceae bacterium]